MTAYNEQINGISLLRDRLLPNLLGEEHSAILYWAGKELARQSPASSEENIVQFFRLNGFGSLSLDKKRRKAAHYILSGSVVSSRLEKHNPSFSLECGFLAEHYQLVHQLYSEATYEIDLRNRQVRLIVHTDKKSPV